MYIVYIAGQGIGCACQTSPLYKGSLRGASLQPAHQRGEGVRVPGDDMLTGEGPPAETPSGNNCALTLSY